MYNKPIIFLDVDGVLNNLYAFKLSVQDIYPPGNIRSMTVDPKCVANLQKIVEATNADIVLSSSWRAGTMDSSDWQSRHGNGTIIRALNWCGWDARKHFIGNTPNNERNFENRGEEIFCWLMNHPERYIQNKTPILILDDDRDFSDKQKEKSIFTNSDIGLTPKLTKQAIQLIRSQQVKQIKNGK